MTGRSALLDSVFAPGALTTAFQPIVETAGAGDRVYAFECLTRGPAGTNLAAADVLFEFARRKGAAAELDRVCCENALLCARRSLGGIDVTLNVHASSISHDFGFADELAAMVERHGFSPRRVIVEIIEHAPVSNRPAFLAALEELRNGGFRIALDDIGLGHSNLKMMVDCAPDYFKIDRYFVQGARHDARYAAAIESIVGFASRLGGRSIAEGIEDEADFLFLRELGLDLFQGYFFARPMAEAEAGRYRTSINNEE